MPSGNLPEVITSGGEVRTLKEGIRKGEYGIQLEPELGPLFAGVARHRRNGTAAR